MTCLRITGDRKETAIAIARDAGLLQSDKDKVFDSMQLSAMSDDELKEFRRVNQMRKERRKQEQTQVVSLRLRPETAERAKSIGKGYTSVLSQIIEEVLNDPMLVKRFITDMATSN